MPVHVLYPHPCCSEARHNEVELYVLKPFGKVNFGKALKC